MALIGEQFTLPDEITGVVLSVGRTDKLSLWFRHGFDNRVAPQIKADLIRLLGLPHDVKTSVSVFFPQNAPTNKQQPAKRSGHQERNNVRELQSYSNAASTQDKNTAVTLDDLLE